MKLYQIMPVAAEGCESYSFDELMGQDVRRLYTTSGAAEAAAEQSLAFDVANALRILAGYSVEEREADEAEIRQGAAKYGWHQIGDVHGRTHSNECKILLQAMREASPEVRDYAEANGIDLDASTAMAAFR